jgi:hypothetical protein
MKFKVSEKEGLLFISNPTSYNSDNSEFKSKFESESKWEEYDSALHGPWFLFSKKLKQELSFDSYKTIVLFYKQSAIKLIQNEISRIERATTMEEIDEICSRKYTMAFGVVEEDEESKEKSNPSCWCGWLDNKRKKDNKR